MNILPVLVSLAPRNTGGLAKTPHQETTQSVFPMLLQTGSTPHWQDATRFGANPPALEDDPEMQEWLEQLHLKQPPKLSRRQILTEGLPAALSVGLAAWLGPKAEAQQTWWEAYSQIPEADRPSVLEKTWQHVRHQRDENATQPSSTPNEATLLRAIDLLPNQQPENVHFKVRFWTNLLGDETYRSHGFQRLFNLVSFNVHWPAGRFLNSEQLRSLTRVLAANTIQQLAFQDDYLPKVAALKKQFPWQPKADAASLILTPEQLLQAKQRHLVHRLGLLPAPTLGDHS